MLRIDKKCIECGGDFFTFNPKGVKCLPCFNRVVPVVRPLSAWNVPPDWSPADEAPLLETHEQETYPKEVTLPEALDLLEALVDDLFGGRKE